MAARLSIKYGIAAVAIAAAIIAATLVATPMLTGTATRSQTGQQGTSSQTPNFLVLLTDPPNVPAGTTQLNLTYSGISLHVTYPNGTAAWVPISASGTVDLLSLVNVTQTIASATIPVGSTVDRIGFTISSVQAEVNGILYPVTSLSNQLLVSIVNKGKVNETLSGGILDLRPSLVQIRATNSTGGAVSYYVLVPSATAILKANVSQTQSRIGEKASLQTKERQDLDNAQARSMDNVSISSASLSFSGNVTDLSITLTNRGTSNVTVFGLTLHGDLNATFSLPSVCRQGPASPSANTTSSSTRTTTQSHDQGQGGDNPRNTTGTERTATEACKQNVRVNEHPDTIPFRVNGTSLVPLFGDIGQQTVRSLSSTTISPGESVTLTYNGVLQLYPERENAHAPSIVLVPVAGANYTARLTGEGFQTAQITAH